ncbi:hypothetical protein [Streptomyces arenae]|uniref:hypothetical protein n=1 Tax=Streptomyces arenae TaxID=29301 RepID=UPI00265B2A12|nr:hypothetical protein [Streptomyces arenae]MCG7203667.1 hypothetical protein [Streptomyces arenae]
MDEPLVGLGILYCLDLSRIHRCPHPAVGCVAARPTAEDHHNYHNTHALRNQSITIEAERMIAIA